MLWCQRLQKRNDINSQLGNGHFQFLNWVGNTASIQQVQSNKQPVKNDSDREVIALSSSVELLSSLDGSSSGWQYSIAIFCWFSFVPTVVHLGASQQKEKFKLIVLCCCCFSEADARCLGLTKHHQSKKVCWYIQGVLFEKHQNYSRWFWDEGSLWIPSL